MDVFTCTFYVTVSLFSLSSLLEKTGIELQFVEIPLNIDILCYRCSLVSIDSHCNQERQKDDFAFKFA
jgi:hypothetical protein